MTKAINSDPASHWEAINNLMKRLIGDHKKAMIKSGRYGNRKKSNMCQR